MGWLDVEKECNNSFGWDPVETLEIFAIVIGNGVKGAHETIRDTYNEHQISVPTAVYSLLEARKNQLTRERTQGDVELELFARAARTARVVSMFSEAGNRWPSHLDDDLRNRVDESDLSELHSAMTLLQGLIGSRIIEQGLQG